MRYELVLAGFSIVTVLLCISHHNWVGATGFVVATLAEIELDHLKRGKQ